MRLVCRMHDIMHEDLKRDLLHICLFTDRVAKEKGLAGLSLCLVIVRCGNLHLDGDSVKFLFTLWTW